MLGLEGDLVVTMRLGMGFGSSLLWLANQVQESRVLPDHCPIYFSTTSIPSLPGSYGYHSHSGSSQSLLNSIVSKTVPTPFFLVSKKQK